MYSGSTLVQCTKWRLTSSPQTSCSCLQITHVINWPTLFRITAEYFHTLQSLNQDTCPLRLRHSEALKLGMHTSTYLPHPTRLHSILTSHVFSVTTQSPYKHLTRHLSKHIKPHSISSCECLLHLCIQTLCSHPDAVTMAKQKK